MALPRRPCADVAPTESHSTTVMRAMYRYAVVLCPSRESAAVAPPTQLCADVAQPERQGTAAVRLPCVCGAMTRFSCASLDMLYPLRQYSRHPGGVCRWRFNNLHDTPCRGDVSSAVCTASRVVGEPRHLARTLLWYHFRGHVPSRITYGRAGRLGSGFATDVVGDAQPLCYGCDPRPALIEPGDTLATGNACDRVA